MPTYQYYCHDCSFEDEVFHSMKEDGPNCPNCQSEKYKRVPQASNVVMDMSQPKTIKDLAIKNTERMISEGKVGKSALSETDQKAKKEQRKKMRRLSEMSSEQKQKYIYEGKM